MSDVIRIKSKSAKILNVGDGETKIDYEKEIQNLKIGFDKILKDEVENAYKEGYEHGYTQARNDLEKVMSEEIELLNINVQNKIIAFDEKISDIEKSFIEIIPQLVVRLSEKVIYSELPKKEIIIGILKEAAQRLVGANEVVIKLNPEDYNLLNVQEVDKMLAASFHKINFEISEKISVGGCFIESELSELQIQLNRIIRNNSE